MSQRWGTGQRYKNVLYLISCKEIKQKFAGCGYEKSKSDFKRYHTHFGQSVFHGNLHLKQAKFKWPRVYCVWFVCIGTCCQRARTVFYQRRLTNRDLRGVENEEKDDCLCGDYRSIDCLL